MDIKQLINEHYDSMVELRRYSISILNILPGNEYKKMDLRPDKRSRSGYQAGCRR